MKYDTIIVGAGPAGLKCAEVLAKNGKEVIVFERKKIVGDKVCAGGLTVKDLNIGIPEKLYQRKIKKIIVHTPKKQVVIEEEEPLIVTVDRKDLGRWMCEQAEDAGAVVQTSNSVTEIKNNSVIVNNDDKIGFKYLIGAEGSHSIVRKSLNLDLEDFEEVFQYKINKEIEHLELFLDPDKFGACYLYQFPHKGVTYFGTGADLSKSIHQPVFDLSIKKIRKNFDSWCMDRFDIKKAQFQAAIISYDYKGFDFGSKFLIGDAGGFASGATGEGIYNAIVSGEEVAKKILDNKYKCPKIKHILKVKKLEEVMLRELEFSKNLTKLELDFVIRLLKRRWFKSFAEDLLMKK